MHFITVDLPEPFGPIRPRISPAAMEKLMSLHGDQAAEALGQAVDFQQRASFAALRPAAAAPMKPPGKNRITTSATAETTKVESSPSGRRTSPATIRKIAPSGGAEDGAPPAQHGGDDDLHADGDVHHRADRGGAEIEDQHRAGQAGEERADAERRQLVLGDVEAERGGLHRVLPAGLQDQPDRRARQAEQDARR